MLRQSLDARHVHLDLRLRVWSGSERNRRIPHDPAQSESQRDSDSFPVGHGPLLSGRGKARGAPGSLEPGRASIVLPWTLAGSGWRVLLTTRLLIEEPERQHDQRDDQADLEDEEKHR